MGWKINALTLLFYKSFVFQDIAQGTSNNCEHFAVHNTGCWNTFCGDTHSCAHPQVVTKLTCLLYLSSSSAAVWQFYVSDKEMTT